MQRVKTKVKKIVLSISLSPESIEKVTNEAEKSGVSRSELIDDILFGKRKAIKS